MKKIKIIVIVIICIGFIGAISESIDEINTTPTLSTETSVVFDDSKYLLYNEEMLMNNGNNFEKGKYYKINTTFGYINENYISLKGYHCSYDKNKINFEDFIDGDTVTMYVKCTNVESTTYKYTHYSFGHKLYNSYDTKYSYEFQLDYIENTSFQKKYNDYNPDNIIILQKGDDLMRSYNAMTSLDDFVVEESQGKYIDYICTQDVSDPYNIKYCYTFYFNDLQLSKIDYNNKIEQIGYNKGKILYNGNKIVKNNHLHNLDLKSEHIQGYLYYHNLGPYHFNNDELYTNSVTVTTLEDIYFTSLELYTNDTVYTIPVAPMPQCHRTLNINQIFDDTVSVYSFYRHGGLNGGDEFYYNTKSIIRDFKTSIEDGIYKYCFIIETEGSVSTTGGGRYFGATNCKLNIRPKYIKNINIKKAYHPNLIRTFNESNFTLYEYELTQPLESIELITSKYIYNINI